MRGLPGTFASPADVSRNTMRKRITHWIWLPLTALAVAGFVVGLRMGQFETVNTWAHTLCTSCIGLGK